MSLPTLFEITQTMENAFALLEREGVERDQAHLDFQKYLDALEVTLEEKVTNCGAAMLSLKAQEDAIAAQMATIQKVAQAAITKLQNRRVNLQSYVLENLDRVGVDKVDSGFPRVRRQKSAGAVEVLNPKSVPAKFKVKQEPRVDLRGIMAEFKAGNTVRGARFVPGSYHLRVY